MGTGGGAERDGGFQPQVGQGRPGQRVAFYLFPPLSSLPPAYEDKQKLKRTEISSRSWFPGTPGPGHSSSKASSVLKKLAQNHRPVPASTPITGGDLGIVRRQSREVSESPQCAAVIPRSRETHPDGTTQDRPASPQDCSQETAETLKTSEPQGQEQRSQDRPQSEDVPHLCALSSSLVADYSDSESE